MVALRIPNLSIFQVDLKVWFVQIQTGSQKLYLWTSEPMLHRPEALDPKNPGCFVLHVTWIPKQVISSLFTAWSRSPPNFDPIRKTCNVGIFRVLWVGVHGFGFGLYSRGTCLVLQDILFIGRMVWMRLKLWCILSTESNMSSKATRFSWFYKDDVLNTTPLSSFGFSMSCHASCNLFEFVTLQPSLNVDLMFIFSGSLVVFVLGL